MPGRILEPAQSAGDRHPRLLNGVSGGIEIVRQPPRVSE